MKIKTRILALAAAGAVILGGVTVAPVAAAPAQAATTCKYVWTGKYKQLNTVHCWFTPSNPACRVKVMRYSCGGSF